MKLPVTFSEKLIPVILLAVAGAVFISNWEIPETVTADLVGPKAYPLALAILLAFLSVLLMVGVGSSEGGDPSITLRGTLRRFLPVVIFSAVYVILLPYLGFLLATTALLMACFYLLGEPRHWLNFLIAAGCTFATYLLFAKGLGVALVAFPG